MNLECHQSKLSEVYKKLFEAQVILQEIHTARTDWYGHILDPIVEAKRNCAAAIGDYAMEKEISTAAKGGQA